MIPRLYSYDETDFTTTGEWLSDTSFCTVEEEINGIYELALEYPADGLHANRLVEGNLITATHDSTGDVQPFRIYRRTDYIDGRCSINARHLSYDLTRIPVMPFSIATPDSAMQAIKTNAAVECPFDFYAEMYQPTEFTTEVPQSAKSVLCDGEGSIIGVFGGELYYDGWEVHLTPRRGQDKDIYISYGVNMTGLEVVSETAGGYTAVVPFYKNQDTLVVCNPPVVSVSQPQKSGAMLLDLSDQFDETPTASDLEVAANSWLYNNSPWWVERAVTLSFVDLAKTENYKDLVPVHELELGDSVLLRHAQLAPRIGWGAKLRLVRSVYDVLRERYIETTFGREAATLSAIISDQDRHLKSVSNSVKWDIRHA